MSPVSFSMTGWYRDMSHCYLELGSTHRQDLWESTHAFRSLRPNDDLNDLCKRSNVNESNADLALGSVGLLRDDTQRYDCWTLRSRHLAGSLLPKLSAPTCRASLVSRDGTFNDQTDQIEALEMAEQEDPWRNQFRNASWDHPELQIPRLQDKFKPAPSS